MVNQTLSEADKIIMDIVWANGEVDNSKIMQELDGFRDWSRHTVSGEMDFDDLMFENGYDPGKANTRAKLSNILFTNELQRRFERAGSDCIAVSTNPGFVRTGWIRHMRERNRLQAFLIGIGLRVLGQSVEMGGLSLLRPAVDANVKGGEYYSTAGRLGGYPIPTESSEASHNKEDAKKLWEVSEKLTGVAFNI